MVEGDEFWYEVRCTKHEVWRTDEWINLGIIATNARMDFESAPATANCVCPLCMFLAYWRSWREKSEVREVCVFCLAS